MPAADPAASCEPYPVIEVRGSPYEMGRQHGEQARERVARTMEYCLGGSRLRLIGGNAQDPPFERDLVVHAETLLPMAEEYAPDLVEECRGIADGSGNDFREILAMQYFVDFSRKRPAGSPPPPTACSTALVVGGAHREGHTLLGWNDDMDMALMRSGIIVRSFPDRGPAITGLSYAGSIPECGATCERVLACNSLPCPRAVEGVPYLFVTRKVLQQRTFLDAIDAIVSARRIVGMNFVVAERSGEYAAIETVPGEFHFPPAQDDLYTHTNHFLAPALAARNPVPPPWRSEVRRVTLERFLHRRRGSMDWDAMLEALSNHVGGLCVHGGASGRTATVTCMLCDLTEGRIAFSSGQPCQNRFQEMKL